MRLVKNYLPPFILAVCVAACGGGDGGGTGGADATMQPPVDPNGTFTQYVMDQLLMPTTSNEAKMYGLNLDGDETNRPDNALGQILSTLGSMGDINLQMTVDTQIADGSINNLIGMKAINLTNATGVGAWVFLGDSGKITPMPCKDRDDMKCAQHLDGNGTFIFDGASPMDAKITGAIVGGRFTGGPGEVTIEVSLVSGSSLKLKLIGARMEIEQVSDTTLISGKLGGAITKDDLDNSVLPTLVTLMKDTIDGDCSGMAKMCTGERPNLKGENCRPCGCTEGATGITLLNLFDELPEATKGDCKVTLEELKQNSLISSLLAPDVDLLDCPKPDSKLSECNFNPRTDMVKDALSLGIGFRGAKGAFTLPTALQ